MLSVSEDNLTQDSEVDQIVSTSFFLFESSFNACRTGTYHINLKNLTGYILVIVFNSEQLRNTKNLGKQEIIPYDYHSVPFEYFF